MRFFLDSSTCVCFLKARFPALRQRILSHRPAEFAIPSLVNAELLCVARKSQQAAENEEVVRQFLLPYALVGFGDREADHSADIRATLGKLGTPIGPNDTIIAAIVRANHGVLVPHNTGGFRRVPGKGRAAAGEGDVPAPYPASPWSA